MITFLSHNTDIPTADQANTNYYTIGFSIEHNMKKMLFAVDRKRNRQRLQATAYRLLNQPLTINAIRYCFIDWVTVRLWKFQLIIGWMVAVTGSANYGIKFFAFQKIARIFY